MNYLEKLKDPRWQKKRLFILGRDEWKCTLCGDSETTLHIHHKEYRGKPWEADDDKLITVCKHCHVLVEDLNSEENFIKKIFKTIHDSTICYCCLLDTGGVIIFETKDSFRTFKSLSFSKSEFMAFCKLYESFQNK